MPSEVLTSIWPRLTDPVRAALLQLAEASLTPASTTTRTFGLLSAADLATKYEVPLDALTKRLERWRYSHDDGYETVANRRRNEPLYLYREIAVLPVVLKGAT
jgi:hypothetical protein